MRELRITLQHRITTLTVIVSVIFIAAFTIIQLNNQVESLNRRTVYQSNLSSIIVKNNLEATIRQAAPQDMAPYMQSGLEELNKASVIKEAVIFTPTGKIVASTDDSLIGSDAAYRDMRELDKLEKASSEGEWFVPEVDTANQSIDIYIGLRAAAKGPITYIARISYLMADIRDAMMDVYGPVTVTILIVIIANIGFGLVLSKVVIGPIKTLNNATKAIAAGDLLTRTKIQTNDELEELGETFNYMTEELIKMKERAENANPLTKLPGNIVIREEAEKRIKANRKFMVIYCDLDNFKAFNDKYGIAKGDEAIKLTADIFKESVKVKGNADDFVGHEGGDDFILLTSPEKSKEIAGYITSEFDKLVRNLYDSEDLKRGHIVAHARDGAVKKFPIMSISLAGVTNEHRPISNYVEITNIAAEVKKKAKAIEGSAFVVDARKQ